MPEGAGTQPVFNLQLFLRENSDERLCVVCVQGRLVQFLRSCVLHISVHPSLCHDILGCQQNKNQGTDDWFGF